jgi:hypothetical protein
VQSGTNTLLESAEALKTHRDILFLLLVVAALWEVSEHLPKRAG